MIRASIIAALFGAIIGHIPSLIWTEAQAFAAGKWLRWYAGNVCNCNRHGSDGDMARDRLVNDIGNRASKVLTEWEAANA